MGKLKSKRKFNNENYAWFGSRNTKNDAKKLAKNIRSKGYKARVIKATKTALKQNSLKYQVWARKK